MTLKTTRKKPLVLLSALAALLLVFATKIEFNLGNNSPLSLGLRMKSRKIESIRAYFPFTFKEKLDPRFIFSVGDQVLAEHLFAFHSRMSIKAGFAGALSDFQFDDHSGAVVITQKDVVRRSNGKEISYNTLCDGLKSSLQGTRHAPYASILKGIECDEAKRQIRVNFSAIPVNLRFLFTVPDFSIFDPTELPMTRSNAETATGPYFMDSVSPGEIVLKINPYYPKHQRANDLETAHLINYKPAETREFINKMDTSTEHMAYFYGHALEASDLARLREKNYVVETFPTEWFTYVLIKKEVAENLRQALIKVVDEFRQGDYLTKNSLGIPAYSMSPGDRQFALTRAEYEEARKKSPLAFDHNTKFKVTTLVNWAKVPFYANLISFLKLRFPNMELELLEPKDSTKLFAKGVDISLSLLGISPSDPLTHLSFLESTLYGFDEIVSKEDISKLAIVADVSVFNKMVKEIELKINRAGLLVPIAHFPGVVAHRNDLIRDDSIANGWGIQTWSFRVD